MGVTQFSLELFRKHVTKPCNVLELGAQCLYINGKHSSDKNKYWCKDLLVSEGYKHTSIDLHPDHEWAKGGRAELADLTHELNYKGFDVVTDFGTSEHVPDLYACWLNKFNACLKDGLIISENPKVGSWQGHGYHYMTREFYEGLVKHSDLRLIELGEHAAMGNTTNGWNVWAVLQKYGDKFISPSEFYELQFETSEPRGTRLMPKFDNVEAKQHHTEKVNKPKKSRKKRK